MPRAQRARTASFPANRRSARHGTPPARVAPQSLAVERRSLDALVAEAAAQITRWTPREAFAAHATDGLLIDIRSDTARERDGVISGSLHIPLTVLEWRVAQDSPWRSPHVGGAEQRLMLICDHGYSSILAARNLVALGFHRAGDVIGGFEAWRQSALPVVPRRRAPVPPGALPGMLGPE